MKTLRILVADDEHTIVDVVSQQLNHIFENKNIIVFKAYNGKEALEIYKKNRIDFIITDCCMPEVDGNNLIDFIRNKEKDYEVGIIIITGKLDYNNINSKNCFVLKKPFSFKDIKSILLGLSDLGKVWEDA